jgi:hypothetical protein
MIIVLFPDYKYVETNSKNDIPDGENWEYWGMRIALEESKAVWRKIKQD